MRKLIQGLLVWAMLMGGMAHAVTDVQDPQQLIRETADYVLGQITANREQLSEDEKILYGLVQERIIPHFDFRRMTQAAMGRYWRNATPEQQNQVVEQFQELLVRTYAKALLSYSGQEIQYMPSRRSPDDPEALVSTKVSDGRAPPIPIDYRLHLLDGAWRIYDVIVDGVSMVTNYRSTFASQVRRGGVDGLINTLIAHNAKLKG